MARGAFWTIIVDDQPTAFRAPVREDLLPTLTQLQRQHPTAIIKWFQRGRLWETPGDAMDASKPPRRESGWRPGGAHKDPRDQYKVPRDVKRARWASQAADGRGPWMKDKDRVSGTGSRGPEAGAPPKPFSCLATPRAEPRGSRRATDRLGIGPPGSRRATGRQAQKAGRHFDPGRIGRRGIGRRGNRRVIGRRTQNTERRTPKGGRPFGPRRIGRRGIGPRGSRRAIGRRTQNAERRTPKGGRHFGPQGIGRRGNRRVIGRRTQNAERRTPKGGRLFGPRRIGRRGIGPRGSRRAIGRRTQNAERRTPKGGRHFGPRRIGRRGIGRRGSRRVIGRRTQNAERRTPKGGRLFGPRRIGRRGIGRRGSRRAIGRRTQNAERRTPKGGRLFGRRGIGRRGSRRLIDRRGTGPGGSRLAIVRAAAHHDPTGGGDRPDRRDSTPRAAGDATRPPAAKKGRTWRAGELPPADRKRKKTEELDEGLGTVMKGVFLTAHRPSPPCAVLHSRCAVLHCGAQSFIS